MSNPVQPTKEPPAFPLTQALGRFVAEVTFDRLPAPALQTARTGFTDCIGTMIAGSPEPAVQILRKTLAPGGPGEAALYLSSERCPAPDAAWINGTAAHALDYDDVALRGHPSTVLVPAILAEAEALDASGRDMLTAYAAGYEVWGRARRAGARPSPPQGVASHGHLRPDRRGGGVRVAPTARRRAGHARDRAGGLAEQRCDGELRHDDEALPCRAGGPRRRHLGSARRPPASPRPSMRSSTPRASSTRCRPKARSTARARLARSDGSGASARSGSASRSSRRATARTARSTPCSISCRGARSIRPGSSASPSR